MCIISILSFYIQLMVKLITQFMQFFLSAQLNVITSQTIELLFKATSKLLC